MQRTDDDEACRIGVEKPRPLPDAMLDYSNTEMRGEAEEKKVRSRIEGEAGRK